jgi:hypothetical protein
MKKVVFIALIIVSYSVASCSKCYDCTRSIPIEIEKNGQKEIVMTEDTEEVCTADKNEIDNKESAGYACS